MITRPCLGYGLFVVLLLTGCASTTPTASTPVVFQSYDLPATVESNAVIRAVEHAFTRTLSKPPRITEGRVASPLPAAPIPFAVEDRHLHLDRLGMVNIPQVVCPGSMAIVQAFVSDLSEDTSSHSVTGCIQLHAGGYRVYIVDSAMTGLDSHENPAGPREMPSMSGYDYMSQFADLLLEEVSGARLVADSRTLDEAIPLPQTGITDPPPSWPERSAAIHSAYHEDNAVSTSPLVCLAARQESAPVRTEPGEGHIITAFGRDSIMTVPEPIDPFYFRVETPKGMAGWVNRSDVKRLPCPIA